MNAIVIAHGGAQATVDRHLPHWMTTFSDVTFICPKDDKLSFNSSIHSTTGIGESCRNGAGAIERMRYAARLAKSELMSCVMEYDTVFKFGRMPDFGWTPLKLVCSSIFDNYDPAFAATIYGHSPWIASGTSWRSIVSYGDDDQGGWPDRWLALAAKKAGIRLLGMDAGYSYDAEWTNEIIEEATQRPRVVFHGVKTEIAFNAVMK